MAQAPECRPFVPEPPTRSFLGVLRDIFLFRLARKHGLVPLRFWIYAGLLLSFLTTEGYIRHASEAGYSVSAAVFIMGFGQWTTMGIMWDLIGHRLEWIEWKRKELHAFTEAHLVECHAKIEAERLRAAEQVKVLAIKTMRQLREQDDQDGEGWKRGAGQQPPGPAQS